VNADARCTFCNWAPHPVSAHGQVCRHGHPVAIVGRTNSGRCRVCHRATVKRYAERHRVEERERSRRYYMRVHGLAPRAGGHPDALARHGSRVLSAPAEPAAGAAHLEAVT
jgi:hypothetical protein